MRWRVTRREFLRAAVASTGSVVGMLDSPAGGLLAQSLCDSSAPLGDLVGLLPLHGDRPRSIPFGEMVGGPGLDARLFTDLARLQPERLITPTAEMFVRTEAPAALKTTPSAWSITARGFDAVERAVTIDELRRDAKPMGAHLIECSGNADPNNFGLLSVTEWDGVPLVDVISTLLSSSRSPTRNAVAILVGGMDDTGQRSASSTPGASWVFPLDWLERIGAFFGVRMNGQPLTPDHGAPVRLVVPGWYGCTWIKWVNELRLVGIDEPATSQMMEFALRTHQGRVPTLARDYDAPAIDLAATPVRVEKRRVDGQLEYRIVGLVWGGDRPVDRLLIRFNAGDAPTPFALCPAPRTHRTWSLWDYRWRPTASGVYNIGLRAADPAIRTRRLDVSFYVRRVVVDEV
jgi:DMSO/TMAO reductase YedYZ molybdopterin-dependent catalytic subunit